MSWILAACASAFFAGVVSVLAKLGVKTTDSDVATAIRTCVVLVFAWATAALAGSLGTIPSLSCKTRVFLVLSGLATGGSWICYFKALSMGDVNKVVPIDKSSTALTVLLAIVLLGETNNLPVKLVGTAVLAAGVLLMVEKRDGQAKGTKNAKAGWLPYAIASAAFAALTAILAKVGITGVESNLGTAIRTTVVLVMAWGIVFAKGKQTHLGSLDRRELGFITLSGAATGASWLCYYYAIQNGIVSVVVPIDKLSILVTIAFSYVVFKEKLGAKAAIGLLLMVCATLAMAVWA